MKIEANDKEIQDIFSLGYFKIPRFQRPYSWTDEEIINFWDDIVLENHEDYFIGSMVVYQEKKPHFGIVDGQQRLTTITLLLAAVRNAFIKIKEENLARGVHNYIEKANIDNINEFIIHTETSFPYFQSHIQDYFPKSLDCNIGNEELKLKNGFELIEQKLKEYIPEIDQLHSDLLDDEKIKEHIIEKLKIVRNKILALKIVFIQLDNEEDAYLIFETLNTRGRDLTTPDLVKNLLLKKLKNGNATYDNPKIVWNDILQEFEDYDIENGMSSFIYHHWLSKYSFLTDKKLFSGVNKLIKTTEHAESFLNELKENSKYYISIVSPNKFNWKKEENKIQESLKALKLFRVKQQSPMLLSLRRSYKEQKISLKMFSKTLKSMESFHFVFNAVTQQRSSGTISSLYSKHAIMLTQAKDHDKVQSVLSSLNRALENKLPEFNEFEAGFTNLCYTTKKTHQKHLIKYILKRFMGDTSNGLPVNHNLMTIEHLIPQSQISSKYPKEIIGSIGNLILIDSKTNAEELKDKEFKQKVELLKNKNYPLEEEFHDVDAWEIKDIKNRTKRLCKLAYETKWKI